MGHGHGTIRRCGRAPFSYRTVAPALAEWPADVAAFADALGLDRVAVVGTSADGSYGFATADALPGLITVAVKEAGGDVVVYPGAGHYLDRAHHADWIAWLLSHD